MQEPIASPTPLSSAQPFTLENVAVRDAVADHLVTYGVGSDKALETANALMPALNYAFDASQTQAADAAAHLNFHEDGGVTIGAPMPDAAIKSVPLDSLAAVNEHGMPTEGVEAIRENVPQAQGMSKIEVVNEFGHDVSVAIGTAGYPKVEVAALKETLEPIATAAGAAPGSVTDMHALQALGDIARGKEQIAFTMPTDPAHAAPDASAAAPDASHKAETAEHKESHPAHAHHAHAHHAHGHSEHGHPHHTQVTASAAEVAKHANLLAPAAYDHAAAPQQPHETHAAAPRDPDVAYHEAEKQADAQLGRAWNSAREVMAQGVHGIGHAYEALAQHIAPSDSHLVKEWQHDGGGAVATAVGHTQQAQHAEHVAEAPHGPSM